MPKHWTQKVRAVRSRYIKKAAHEGKTLEEIAYDLALEPETVRDYAKRQGITVQRLERKRPTRVRHNPAIDTLSQRPAPPTLECIAQQVGKTKEGVRQYLIRTGQYSEYLEARVYAKDPLPHLTKNILRTTYDYGLSKNDIAYFLAVPIHAVDQKLGKIKRHKGMIKRFGSRGSEATILNYRIASQVYYAQDQSLHPAQIADSLCVDPALIAYALKHRKTIGKTITDSLLLLYPGKIVRGPYVTPNLKK